MRAAVCHDARMGDAPLDRQQAHAIALQLRVMYEVGAVQELEPVNGRQYLIGARQPYPEGTAIGLHLLTVSFIPWWRALLPGSVPFARSLVVVFGHEVLGPAFVPDDTALRDFAADLPGLAAQAEAAVAAHPSGAAMTQQLRDLMTRAAPALRPAQQPTVRRLEPSTTAGRRLQALSHLLPRAPRRQAGRGQR